VKQRLRKSGKNCCKLRAESVKVIAGAAAFGFGMTLAPARCECPRSPLRASIAMPRDGHRSNLVTLLGRAFQQAHWQPSVDAHRTARGWVLKYELAGVLPNEIELTVNGRAISVRGMRRDLRLEEGQQSYRMEICYNQFERTVELPCDLSELDVSTDYRDGMLFVWLTCKETNE
jgi:HSP20 family molecular chaperone IbpA